MVACMNPLLVEMPDHLATHRLLLRCPTERDASQVNAAVCESLADLRPWMPWAQIEPSLVQSQADCRRLQARFLLREDLAMFIFERRADGSEGRFIGGTGLHRLQWEARCFEIGYWCRTSMQGQGFVGEAVGALSHFAFGALGAQRIEVRMDEANERSRRVAERAGFELEGVLRSASLTPQGALRDTRVYARLRSADERACTDA